jgi:transcriptional regulator with XRE-family HTH domain
MKQTEISAIEKGRTTLGADRAVKLARALRVHPAVLLFPSWEEEEPGKRATRTRRSTARRRGRLRRKAELGKQPGATRSMCGA